MYSGITPGFGLRHHSCWEWGKSYGMSGIDPGSSECIQSNITPTLKNILSEDLLAGGSIMPCSVIRCLSRHLIFRWGAWRAGIHTYFACGNTTLNSIAGTTLIPRSTTGATPKSGITSGVTLKKKNQVIIFLFFPVFLTTPVILRGSLCTQKLLVVVLGRPYGILEIEPRSTACKTNALPALLLLWPQNNYFLVFPYIFL